MKGPVFIHYILNKMTNSSTEIKEEQINEKSGQKKRNKKCGSVLVPQWSSSDLSEQNSFSSKEVEPEYTTYTITEMASLKLDGQVSFLDTRIFSLILL